MAARFPSPNQQTCQRTRSWNNEFAAGLMGAINIPSHSLQPRYILPTRQLPPQPVFDPCRVSSSSLVKIPPFGRTSLPMDSHIRVPPAGPGVSAEGLGPEHHNALVRAIRNVLSTALAERTFAQLLDGIPLATTVLEMRGSLILVDHPLHSHNSLCAGAMERAKILRDTFDPSILRFSPTVCLGVSTTDCR